MSPALLWGISMCLWVSLKIKHMEHISKHFGERTLQVVDNVPSSLARKSGKKTRFYKDNEFLERGYVALFPKSVSVVYDALLKYANSKTQTCFPSVSTIVRIVRCSRSTVFRNIKLLKEYNIISVQSGKGRKQSNFYTMVDSSQWKPAVRTVTIGVKKDVVAKRVMVSKQPLEWCQKEPHNGVKVDTLNHIKKSENINPNSSYKKEELSEFTLKNLEVKYGSQYRVEIIVKAAIKALKDGIPTWQLVIKNTLVPYLEKAALASGEFN